MTLYTYKHILALEFHLQGRYTGNRQTHIHTHTNRLPYAHRGIITQYVQLASYPGLLSFFNIREKNEKAWSIL